MTERVIQVEFCIHANVVVWRQVLEINVDKFLTTCTEAANADAVYA